MLERPPIRSWEPNGIMNNPTDIDVTSQVLFGENDGEYLPLTRCVCGHTFEPWDEMISIYRDDPYACDYCGRKLYFIANIKVIEIVDNE